MSSHRISADHGRALQNIGEAKLPEVSSSSTLSLGERGFAVVNVTATCTLTFPDSNPGTEVLVTCDDTSTVTLADSGGTFGVFTGTTGTTAALCIATDSNSWGYRLIDRNSSTALSSSTLQSMYAKQTSNYGHVDIPLSCFREVDADGDVGNAAAIGGVLTSDTTPIFEGSGTTNAQRINWATGNVDRIAASVTLPRDFDGTAACQIGVVFAGAGATNGFDATVVTNWNGGADVTDTLIDDASDTVHRIETTVAAADIPDSPMSVSVSLTPPAHATDAFYLYGAYVRYQKKLTEA